MSIWQFVVKGGVLMIPIIFCGVLTFTVILEKLIFLKNAQIDTEKFLNEIETSLRRRKIKEALEICNKYSSKPIPNIIKEGLIKFDRNREEIKEAIGDAAVHEIPKLERYLGILVTIATVAPLLGLLGTVTGLIKAFMVIESHGGLVNPGDLAGGVWEALITTVGGLVIAIPAYLSYNYFVTRVNNMVLQMEKSATKVLDIFFLLKSEEE